MYNFKRSCNNLATFSISNVLQKLTAQGQLNINYGGSFAQERFFL